MCVCAIVFVAGVGGLHASLPCILSCLSMWCGMFVKCSMHCGWYINRPAHGLCNLVTNRGLCVATVDLRTAVVYSGIWAHGQALDALRGCFSRSCLYGPAMVLLHKGCRGVGVTTGCPILPLDLLYGVNNRLHGPAHCN